MSEYKVYWTQKGIRREITGFVGDGMTWRDNIDALASELSFSIATNPHDTLLQIPEIAPGDRISLMGEGRKEVMRGIVSTVTIDGAITVYDFGYYLNKSEIVLQCNGVAADQAIRLLCRKAGVPVAAIPTMPTLIRKNYIGQSPAEILRDIISQVTAERSTRFFYRIEGAALAVRPYPTEPIHAYATLPEQDPLNITWRLGSLSGERSMEELKNSVTIVSEGDQASVLATAQDAVSVACYGWLQTVETAAKGTSRVQAEHRARSILTQKNRIIEMFSIGEILGSDDVRCGVMLRFNSQPYGLTGNYIVTEATHIYGAEHTMRLNIEKAGEA